jgi:hypothetical protein
MDKEQQAQDQTNDSPESTPPAQVSPPVSSSVPTEPQAAAQLEEVEHEVEAVEREMNAFERATLRWTRATFVILAVTCLFIGFQWTEMRSGGQDTHDLAVAAKAQAGAMAAQLTAFENAQSARLSIEDLTVNDVGTELSYVFVNRGNSIALNISEGGRGGEFKNWDEPRAQIAQFNKEMTPPPKNGFSLAQGDRQSRTLAILPNKNWWSYGAFFTWIYSGVKIRLTIVGIVLRMCVNDQEHAHKTLQLPKR